MSRFVPIVAVAFAFAAIACGDPESGETAVEDAAAELGDRVDDSAEIMKDTYEADRKKGEDVVDAAGDAYEEVLEAGANKAAK